MILRSTLLLFSWVADSQVPLYKARQAPDPIGVGDDKPQQGYVKGDQDSKFHARASLLALGLTISTWSNAQLPPLVDKAEVLLDFIPSAIADRR